MGLCLFIHFTRYKSSIPSKQTKKTKTKKKYNPNRRGRVDTKSGCSMTSLILHSRHPGSADLFHSYIIHKRAREVKAITKFP